MLGGVPGAEAVAVAGRKAPELRCPLFFLLFFFARLTYLVRLLMNYSFSCMLYVIHPVFSVFVVSPGRGTPRNHG